MGKKNPSLPKRGAFCSFCNKKFQKGDHYFSLVDIDDAPYKRDDYCHLCWEQENVNKEGSFWEGTIPFKQDKGSSPDERALAIFKNWPEEGRDLSLRYLLALYLARKGQLTRCGKKGDQILFEIPQTGETYLISTKRDFHRDPSAIYELNTVLNECADS